MRRLGGIKSSGMGSSRLQVLRGILRELKLLSPVKEPVISTVEGQFLISEYRQFSKAGETVANILYYDSLYYLCLLTSQREAMDLFLRYKGRGERSVEETAGLVGFKLPKQYQDP
ncbi:unnamed protein product [Porites lobata]|uniref:Protein FMC1 homolog n=1 Tax=Porites lobata TaxID=104759 RepID=A0ABN8Q4F5_9CNID|nr:unnamed protein product [Porites lobata]